MNETPRTRLREIIQQYGPDVSRDKRRCKGLLLDYCGDFRKEVNILVAALDEGVVEDLLSTSPGNVPGELRLKRLIQRLCDERSLENAAARWAVETWIFALGIRNLNLTEAQLPSLPQRSLSAQAAPAERPAPLPRRRISPPVLSSPDPADRKTDPTGQSS